MTHTATIHEFRRHHQASKILHASERRTKRQAHLSERSKAHGEFKLSKTSCLPLRSYSDARAIAAEEMAALVADGGSVVLSPCSAGWIATCRSDDNEKSPARRGWSLAIFDEGHAITMRYPPLELRFLRIMIEAEGAYAHRELEAMPSSVPTSPTFVQRPGQISVLPAARPHLSTRLAKVWHRHAA